MSDRGASIDPGFSTPAMSACFSPEAHVRAMLQVEAALALSCADAGIDDRAVADEIAATCAALDLDATQLLSDGWQVGTPVIALRTALRDHLSAAAARVVESGHGSTTQDIVDTAVQLQMRAGLLIIERDLLVIARRLTEFARAHRTTPMIGRTFLQHAHPTTFGLRCAQWLDPVADLVARIPRARSACRIQLGGPVGTLEELGADAEVVSRGLAARLELHQPITSWHTDRRPVADVCVLVGQVAGCMAKIASDVAVLSSSEIGEISVRTGGSSSMAGKRNPFDAVRALAAADACAGNVGVVSSARPIELERGLGGWHVEWLTVPLAFMTCAAAVDAMTGCLESLTVDEVAMRGHLSDADVAGSQAAAASIVDRILGAHGSLDES